MSGRIEVGAEHVAPMSCSHAMQGVALVAIAVMLSACSKAPSVPPAPMTTAPQVEPSTARAGGSDPSVPNAGSVLTPSAAPNADPAAGRTNDAMTRGQESSAMPMAGQNNDHSAPVGPAKPASSPQRPP
jgi:hypothetical protein